MKKVLIATGIAALAIASFAGAQGYMYSTNLTVGSTGADVVALQTMLISAGYSIPALQSGAVAKGYFGSQTKSAVQKYQAAKGLPSTGFVGPMTRGVLNGGVAVVPVTVPCPVGMICTPINPVTPVVPVTPGVITTTGAEGLIITKLASNPISDANIRDFVNVPVYGIEIKAQGSDMLVDRVLLQFQVGVGGAGTSVSNPATFIRKVSAYDGSALVKSWDVSYADFNKDSSDRYYVIASGMNFVVPKDTTKVLTFKVDTIGVSSDQSARYVTVQGYAGNTQNVRAVDGRGLNSYTDMSGTSNSRVQTFNTSGSSSLTVTLNAAATPKSTNNKVDSTDGIKKMVTQVLDVKSTTGASVVKNVCIASNATSTAGLPSTLYLYSGSSLLGSVSAGATDGAVSCFTDLSFTVGKDETKQLTVMADFASTVTGQAASTSIAANGIKFEKPDSTTASSTNSEIAGNSQYLWAAAPQWTLVSAEATASTGEANVASSSVTGTIVLKAKAVGGAMTKPVAGDFTLVFASSTQTTYTTANSVTGGQKVVTVTPSDATISEGGEYTVTLTDTIYSNDSEIGSSQPLFMVIKDIDSVVGGNTITDQTWGVDTFFTPAKQLTKGTL
jgi:peptidoglycan hydrolase-like protein with peptidoglycan-binding domain